MIAKKRRKSKSKKRSFREKSRAAKRGWIKRKENQAKEIRRLEMELTNARTALSYVQKREGLEQAADEEFIRNRFRLPPRRILTRKEMIDQFLNRAERLYGSGPGILDTAKDLADYYGIDIDQVFDEWYEETG